VKFKLFKINFQEIDILILSNTHINFIGRRPLLYKKNFKEKIICTGGNSDTCNNVLINSAYIQNVD